MNPERYKEMLGLQLSDTIHDWILSNKLEDIDKYDFILEVLNDLIVLYEEVYDDAYQRKYGTP